MKNTNAKLRQVCLQDADNFFETENPLAEDRYECAQFQATTFLNIFFLKWT